MKPIRVLHIVSAMQRGGVETMIMNFYRNIDRNQIQFDFIVHGDTVGNLEDEIVELGGRIFHVVTKRDSFFKNQKQIYRILKKNSYNIVHVHQDAMSMFALKIAKKAQVTHRIAHAHSTSMPPSRIGNIIYKYALKNMLKYTNHKFTCSRASAEYLFGSNNIDDLIYIRNGVDVNKYKFSVEMRTLIRKENNWDDCFVLGHIGNFLYPKNHEFVIEVFKQLLQVQPNSKLVLCGSGMLMDMIKIKVKNLGISDNVVFMGNVSNVNHLLSGMDCLILPSLYEGFPVVTVEAQCADIPIIVSDNITKETNLSEAIEYLSLSDTPEVWANKIVHKCKNYKRCDKSGDMLASGYDIESIAQNLEKLYLSMKEKN